MYGHVHTDINRSYRWIALRLGFVCIFTRASLYVLAFVILCLVYLLFVTVWLSVPMQLIAWKDSSLKRPNYVSSGTLNHTQLLTHRNNFSDSGIIRVLGVVLAVRMCDLLQDRATHVQKTIYS